MARATCGAIARHQLRRTKRPPPGLHRCPQIHRRPGSIATRPPSRRRFVSSPRRPLTTRRRLHALPPAAAWSATRRWSEEGWCTGCCRRCPTFRRRHVTKPLDAILPDRPPAFLPRNAISCSRKFGGCSTILASRGSRAEVPIVGRLEGGRFEVSGQVDRLAVTNDSVLIADYKTNRPAPSRLPDVPDAYIAQLALYRAVLGRLYTGRRIRAALVWTDVPDLMEISDARLDAALAAITSP